MRRHVGFIVATLVAVALYAIAALLIATHTTHTLTPAVPVTGTTTTVGPTAGGSVHPPNWGRPSASSDSTSPLFSIVRTGVMYDDVNLDLIPPGPFALAGYRPPSSWPTYTTLLTRWPRSHNISISVNVSVPADCGDFEPGDMVPSQAATWYFADRRAGYRVPCEYSSIWEFEHQIRPVLAAAHIPRDQVLEWDANYDYVPHLDASFDATQFTDRALGRSLDESEVTLAFLKIATPPYSLPKPTVNYRVFLNTSFRLSGHRLNERATVKAYDAHRTRALLKDLRLLAARIDHVAHIAPNGHHYRHVQWKFHRLQRERLILARVKKGA